MPWTRASELDRSLRCVGSKLIPANRLVSENTRKAGAWGTFVHYWKETGELLDTSEFYESFKKTFDKKWDLIGSPELRENLWPESGIHEAAFSFDCETGSVGYSQEPGKELWKQNHPESWVTGTCDYVGETEGILWVDDLKTGALYDTPPDRSLQLYFYAMCAGKFFRGRIVDVAVTITRWPKYPLSIIPERKTGFLPATRIRRFEQLLVAKYQSYVVFLQRDIEPHMFSVGDQCTYCPSIQKCPVVQ